MAIENKIESILGRRQNGRWIRKPEVYMDYLRNAARLLMDRSKWTQQAFARDSRGKVMLTARIPKHSQRKPVKFDMIGALEHVTPDFRDFFIAKLLLAAGAGVPHEQLSRFNDRQPADEAYKQVVGAYAIILAALAELKDVEVKS